MVHFSKHQAVPQSEWRANQQVLEDALEKAYKSPGIYTYTRSIHLPGIGHG